VVPQFVPAPRRRYRRKRRAYGRVVEGMTADSSGLAGFRLPAFVAVFVGLLAMASPELRAGDQPPPAAGPARSTLGRPSDPAFFPLAVWLQSPRNAQRYKDLGINTYVALWRGPTDEQLDALDAAGMLVVVGQGERSLKFRDRKTIVGWMHDDEPDNAQSLGRGKGYGPPIKPEKIVEDYKRMKAADPDRPVMLNLGQGVAYDNYIGRGVRRNHPEDYREYLKGCDVASFDIYPVVHESPEVAGKLEFVGRGVKRLVDWTGGAKPVWSCIETTHISNPEKIATPAQIRSEVWMALIHGAKGIIYFCHEFKPRQSEAGLLEHPENAAAVKAVNAQIKGLAPVLNSPTVPDGVRATSSDSAVPVEAMCKRHGGATYVFAVSMRDKAATATFELPGVKGDADVEVIGEGRTVRSSGGRFSDGFGGYAAHLYRVAI
jgi:hypothetical protein